MTSTVRPFTGHVPTSAFGGAVVGPPKSLIPASRAKQATDEQLSFRHSVGRGAGPTAEVATDWVRALAEQGALHSVTNGVVVHAAERQGQSALGMLADVSVDAYERNVIKAHEKTITATEQKMVGYMLLTRLLGNPVVIAHRRHDGLADQLARLATGTPDADFEARDGTHHRFWIVEGDAAADLTALLDGDLYIADGHHRLEAARALARAEGRRGSWFPAGLYADDEFALWAFARGVHDSGVAPGELIERLEGEFDLTEVDTPIPRPSERASFGVRIDGRSFVLTIPPDRIDGDVHDRLDVTLLQRLILTPMLGIVDPRLDERLDVIADSGDAAHDPDLYDAWFLPFPTSPTDVMAVADMGRTMPPKSTFFLPKLPGGIMMRQLDE